MPEAGLRKNAVSEFIEVQPTLENVWRSIILFGRNVASYKFALGKSLLELSAQENEVITLEQLAEPFSRHVCDHLRLADKQATSPSSRFLDACRRFNRQELKKEELIETTVKFAFMNVIDAFHVVNTGEVGVRFFIDERRGPEKGIRLAQDLFSLSEQFQYQNLPGEVEARWRLVETAWGLNLPRHVLTVDYEATSELLVVNDRTLIRRVITSCRDALNGYQKGKCLNGTNLSHNALLLQLLFELPAWSLHDGVLLGSAFADARFVAAGTERVHVERR